MEHAFGSGPDFALGVEEELLFVQPPDLRLAHIASTMVPALDVEHGTIAFDTYEAVVELISPIARTAGEAVGHLRAQRATLRAAGATLLGAGIHPAGAFYDVIHVPRERYAEIAAQARGLLKRTPTCAVHVHVGMPDADTAIRVCNRLRAFLPLVQALAANSPFWYGLDSGLASARASLFRAYPRAEIPREFSSWEDFAAVTEAVLAAGDLGDYTFFWWDIRPHPRLGTVEVRAMDAQSRQGTVAGLAALLHAAARRCAEESPQDPLPPREALAEASFVASRDGLGARLPWDGALRPVPEVARLALAWVLPAARDLGGEAELEEVERVLRDGGGADRQRAAYATGGMEALLAGLAAEAREPR